MTTIILAIVAIPILLIGSMIYRACRRIYKEDLHKDLPKKEKKLYRGNKDYLRKLN
jgi:hypothetical protein